jgi:hypothetical protein
MLKRPLGASMVSCNPPTRGLQTGGAQEEEVARLEHELAACRAEQEQEAARLEAELAECRSEREELAAAAAATQARLTAEVLHCAACARRGLGIAGTFRRQPGAGRC